MPDTGRKFATPALIGILLLAAWLRLDRLAEVPPSLYCDEAAVGYDAWSIATSGMDQWGNTMPAAFFSFSEYKNPVHIYATALVMRLVGYNDFTVRLPSAMAGLLCIALLFLVARRLVKSDWIALAGAGLLSVSPQHVQFSRMAWEVNFALAFFLAGLLAFVTGVTGRRWLIVLAGALWGIDLYTYNAAKIFVPLFILLVVVVYRRDLWRWRGSSVLAASLFGLAVSISLIRPELSGLTRFQNVQLFPAGAGANATQSGSANDSLLERATVIGNQYAQHFGPSFLFQSGDPIPRHSNQHVGETYWFDLVLLPIGLITLLRRRSPADLVVLGWFFLAPLPASIVEPSPHATRFMYALGGWHLVSAAGLATAWKVAHIKWRPGARYAIALGMSFALTASVLTFVHTYFNVYPVEYSQHFDYGLNRFFEEYANDLDRYTTVTVLAPSQPYIIALHQLKYDPEKFRASAVLNRKDQLFSSTAASFGKFRFNDIDMENLPPGKGLVVTTPSRPMEQLDRIGMVRSRDGSVAVLLYEYAK